MQADNGAEKIDAAHADAHLGGEPNPAQIFLEAASESVVPAAGEFVYDAVENVLTWSEEMYGIYGTPRSHTPTLDSVLAHSHPDDTTGRAVIIHNLLHEPGPTSYAYRIIRTDGAVRNVVMAARSYANSEGTVVRVVGHLIDITDHMERAMSHRVGDALAGIVDARAEIEQAKGIIMLAFGVAADRAFDVLAWQSQAHNIKVRDLAARIVVDVRESFSLPQSHRDVLGRLLMSAYTRVTARA